MRLQQTPTSSAAEVIPFLILNHQLDSAHLRRMVRDCARAGLDGVFLHPREGLLTPYLSEAWFEAVGACVAEAKRCGIRAWLYDEFPYPSGVAGGRVVESDPTFAERHLRIHSVRVRGGGRRMVPLTDDRVLNVFLSPIRQGEPDHTVARDVTDHVGLRNDTWLMRPWDSRYYYAPKYARLYDCPRSTASQPWAVFEGDVPDGDWQLTVYAVRTGGEYLEPFGHYVDVSNRKATARFLELTHEAYWKRFGRDFGRTIPGFFTDEPKYRNLLPWSDAIAAAWSDYQKDPRALLALATEDIQWSLPRRGEPRLPWRGLRETDPARAHLRMRYRQVLLRLFREHWARPVSRWCARHGVALTGHISPEEEWVQEAALCGSILQLLKTFHIPGCDLIIPATGDRFHPILNFTPSLACSVAAQCGRSRALVELFGANDYSLNVQDMKRIAEWLATFGLNVFVNHSCIGWLDGYRKYDAPPTFYKPSPQWPFLGRWADQIRATASRLGPRHVRVGLVIVRPMRTLWRLGPQREREARALFELAMDIILHLQERGILFHWMDDMDLAAASVRAGQIRVGRARYPLLVYLEDSLDEEATAALRRLRSAGARILNHHEARRLLGALSCPSGMVRAVQNRDGQWFCLNLSPRRQSFRLNGQRFALDGYESRWLEADAGPGPRVARTLPLGPRWTLRPAADNVVVLQNWTLNGKRTVPAPYFESAPPGEIPGWEPVALGRIPAQPKLPRPLELLYATRFRIRGVRDLWLVIEGETIRGQWAATLNGKPLRHWQPLFRYDPTNRQCDLSHAIRPGLNRLEFRVRIERSSDGLLEPCRLYGRFHVRRIVGGIPTLEPAREIRGTGDWCRLGFPHYSGTMIHAQTFLWERRAGERVELALDRPPRDQVVVFLNGRRAGELLWSPWRLDVTRHIRDGENRLELHVSNTLINLFYGRPRPSGLSGGVRLVARLDAG